MRNAIFFPLLITSMLISPVGADPIPLNQKQIEKAGIVTTPLGSSVAVGGLTLPAQIVIPPAQIEVLAAPASALVTGVRVAYGDAVKKGQALVRLQGGALLELQRDVLTARAQVGLAAENRRRDEALFADGIIPQSRLSATRAAEAQAQALVDEKSQSLRMSGVVEPERSTLRTAVTELRAPFDGVVLEVTAQPGQRVDATTPLLKLARISPLWLEIQASTAQASRLAPGDQVLLPGCTATGEIRLIAPQIQSASQSQLVRAVVAKPAGCVKPFQFVHVTVTPSSTRAGDSWRLPASAVARHQGQAWVFVADGNGFVPVEVKVSDETSDAMTVTGPLKASSAVVTKGVATLKAAWLGLGASSAAQESR